MGESRFKTLAKLKKKNIREFQGTKLLITNNSDKRDNEIILLPEAIEIAEKYNYKFSVIIGTYTDYLWKIATLLAQVCDLCQNNGKQSFQPGPKQLWSHWIIRACQDNVQPDKAGLHILAEDNSCPSVENEPFFFDLLFSKLVISKTGCRLNQMLATKLHIPTTNVNLVHRSALFELLNKGLSRKLILISAPAGFGKTTIISDWINHKKIPTAWYSIDGRDNDPAEFLNYIISGIRNIKSDFGLGVQQLLVVRQSLFSLYNESVVKGN